MTTTQTWPIDTATLGTLISSLSGYCAGPEYGEVYTAPQGQSGFIAGYRTSASPGLGLIGRRKFASKTAALNYAQRCSRG